VRARFTLSPRGYARVATAAVAALTLVVLTGAAVRLTDSGLGCPDWPRCQGGIVAPLETHAWIEYGNRLFAGLVGVICVIAFVLAFRRRPFRRDLAVWSALLPLGCAAQGALGALTVATGLAPELVMSHFALSMLILVPAVGLLWRARHEPGARSRPRDKAAVWAARALVPLAAITLLAGMVSTAAGPHAGDPGEVDRLDFRGVWTLEWAIEWHGYFAWALGLGTITAFAIVWRRRGGGDLLRAVGLVALLVGAQGLVGVAQYAWALPAELVWVHVTLATVTWIAVLWAAVVAGRLSPRGARAAGAREPARERTLEPVG